MNIDLTELITNRSESIVIRKSFELDSTMFKNSSIRELKNTYLSLDIVKLCDNSYEIEGTITGTMILPDDITLEDVEYNFESNIKEKFCDKKNLENNLEIIQNRLDITEFLWQNILVEIPPKVKSDETKDLELEGEGWRLVTEENLRESNNSPLSELSKLLDSRKE